MNFIKANYNLMHKSRSIMSNKIILIKNSLNINTEFFVYLKLVILIYWNYFDKQCVNYIDKQCFNLNWYNGNFIAIFRQNKFWFITCLIKWLLSLIIFEENEASNLFGIWFSLKYSQYFFTINYQTPYISFPDFKGRITI